MADHAKGKPRVWVEEDFDLIEEYYAMEARENLWAFRQYMDPNLTKGWFPQDISEHFQAFYERLINGERPKMVVEAPPQHGKSRGLADFVAWVAGKSPELRTIYASFSEDLGTAANMYLQRMIDDREKYGRVFPKTQISASNVVTAVAGSGRYLRNSNFLEFVNQKGSFRNTTVRGQINGKSLDLGLIDDPLKGREAAQSKQVRDSTWAWLSDDFFSRFSEYAGLILTATRWHVDDPTGRFLAQFPDAIVLKYPAEYVIPRKVPGEPYRSIVKDKRKVGEPLFPQFKSKAFLAERKKNSTQASWESLYQQSPIVSGGGMFPIDKVRYAQNMPTKEDIKRSVRYWDKAGTEGGGKRTAGVLMHLLKDGRFYVSSVIKGQWNAWDREAIMKSTAQMDRATWGRVENWVEQEPGSGGKESAERTIANLAGFSIRADKVTGSKEDRAEPYAAQWQGGNVILHANPKWNVDYVDEHETFPAGTYIDQVDAAAGAFAKLINKTYKYDSTLAWVG
jgi:predicted phage terminase large subunit-like protein